MRKQSILVKIKFFHKNMIHGAYFILTLDQLLYYVWVLNVIVCILHKAKICSKKNLAVLMCIHVKYLPLSTWYLACKCMLHCYTLHWIINSSTSLNVTGGGIYKNSKTSIYTCIMLCISPYVSRLISNTIACVDYEYHFMLTPGLYSWNIWF